MSHVPNLQDAACDLLRCVYFSNYEKFFVNAEKIINQNRELLSRKRLGEIKSFLEKAKDSRLNIEQKREHLVTASILLQNSYKISS